MTAGTLSLGAYTTSLTVTGATSIASGATLSITSATGTKTFTGSFTNNGTFSNSSVNSPITFGNSITNNGTFTPGTGTYTLTGAAMSINSTSALTFTALSISGTYTNNISTGTGLTVSTTLSGAGGLTNGTNAILVINPATAGFTLTTLTASASGNSVTYSGSAAQTIKAGTYYNLTANNSTGFTLGGSITVSNQLTLTSGAFPVGANTLTLNGPEIAGTPTLLTTIATSSLSYGGSSTGIIIPSTVASLTNLTINNASGISLSSSISMSGTFTLTSGVVTLGSNTLTMTSNLNTSLVSTPSITTMIRADGTGQFIRAIKPSIASNTSYVFPVGDLSNYSPVTLTFSATAATAGNIGIKVVNSTESNMNNSSAPGVYLSRYWTFSNTFGANAYTYTGTFTYPAANVQPNSGFETYLLLSMWTGSAWTQFAGS